MKIELMQEMNNDFPRLYFMHKQVENNQLPEKLQIKINTLVEQNRFDQKLGSVVLVELEEFTYIVVGLGIKSELDDHDFRMALYKGLVFAKENKFRNLNIVAPELDSPSLTIKKIAIMIELSLYEFDQYRTLEKAERMENVYIVSSNLTIAQRNALEEGILLAESNTIARDLVNQPPNILNAKELSKSAARVGKAAGFDVEIFKEDKISKFGMGAYLAVAAGSANRPRLIVMRYFGNKESKEILGFVGKGLTYDSGGYNLKSAEGLLTMKSDMGGAAAVIGAMNAIAKAKLEVNVIAVVAACENAISSTSYRPDDILTTMSGKTVLCENTDAEGRFTLIDAITYIQRKEKVTKIIDLATLTGAAIRTLGTVAALTASNNDQFYSLYQAAAKDADERVWRMPLFKEYKEQLKCDIADYTHIGGNPGAIVAATFLENFVEDNRPWIHVDIAPVAYNSKKNSYYGAGASGFGAISLYELAKSEQA